ncbi:hypothetical protein ACN6K5_002895, partial [Streptomyces violaceoruber]
METLTTQSTAFWHYLDRTQPETDWSGESAALIGERYGRFQPSAHRATPAPWARIWTGSTRPAESPGRLACAGFMAAAPNWICWASVSSASRGSSPGRGGGRHAEALAGRPLLLDHRRFDGPVHLDGTRWVLPLRQWSEATGMPTTCCPSCSSCSRRSAPAGCSCSSNPVSHKLNLHELNGAGGGTPEG